MPVKSEEQHAAVLHHPVRDLIVRQQTMLITALRGHRAEFGIIAPAGHHTEGWENPETRRRHERAVLRGTRSISASRAAR